MHVCKIEVSFCRLGLERICGEAAARGSQENEREMKFLLDVMHQARCAEWAFMVCV